MAIDGVYLAGWTHDDTLSAGLERSAGPFLIFESGSWFIFWLVSAVGWVWESLLHIAGAVSGL